MYRANILLLIGALCLLASPAWTVPTDAIETTPEAPQESVTEAASPPKFSGGEQGMISRVGVDGPFQCKKITCPPGTQTCKYASKYATDGKTAEVQYKCIASNDTILLEETKTEPIELQPPFNFNDMFNNFFPSFQGFKFPFFN